MQALRKLRHARDDAVSPVIAVILMVAITVVLAATVYVWVSNFGNVPPTPPKSISLVSAGPLDANGDKTYTVASATAGMRWQDATVTVNGVPFTLAAAACTANVAADAYRACGGGVAEGLGDTVNAGDQLTLGDVAASETLRILDTQANSVMLTLNIG